MRISARLRPVVALACSAGGTDALQRVGPRPAGFPGPVIVLLHQPPDRPSHLSGILGRSCRLPIRTAAHGDGRFPGRYVAGDVSGQAAASTSWRATTPTTLSCSTTGSHLTP